MNQAIENRPLHTYAEPLAGLRVSWGAILAGALATVGVALVLWALALAIVLTASTPTVSAFRADTLALWICAMVTTLIGAFVGGALSGFLPGNPRRAIGAVHGFLAWAVAFVFVTVLSGFAIGSMLRTSIMAAARMDEASELSGEAPPLHGMQPRAGQGVGPGVGMGQAPGMGMGEGTYDGRVNAARVDRLSRAMVDWSAGLAWSWFGTWAIAGAIATLAGASATRRSRKIDAPDDTFPATPRMWSPEAAASGAE